MLSITILLSTVATHAPLDPFIVVLEPRVRVALQDPKRVTGQGFPKLSPFRRMRRTADGGLDVQVDDATWHRLVSVESVETADLVRLSKIACGIDKWYERLREDLVEVLSAIGKDVSDGKVDLELRDLATGKVRRHEGVEMTRAKRQALRARENEVDRRPTPASLDATAIEADLTELAEILRERHSYFERPGQDADLDALFARVHEVLTESPVPHHAFVRAVDYVLRAYGDGHMRLRTSMTLEAPGFTPVLVDRAGEGYVAFEEDRTAFVDAERPYLVAIDGLPLARWLAASERRYATNGSEAMRSRDAVRGLRFLGELRAVLDLEPTDRVELTVAKSPDGAGSRTVTLPVRSDRRPIYGPWPRPRERSRTAASHRMLDGNIGYLRVRKMSGDPDFLDALDEAMADFRDADALILDVRGNGGGSRDALRRLLPYFLRRTEGPAVVNVAAYRIPPEERGRNVPEDGELGNRFLYPEDWDGWSPEERAAVRRIARTFEPEWRPTPRKGFSDWRYFTISRSDNPAAEIPFERPVALLIDDGCFSATDIFVAAFKGRPGVTLVGSPTLGGSGRSRRYELTRSGIEFQASSMASFRPDGTLYDGRGIRPDLLVDKRPTDFLLGQGDAQLEAALELLR